MLSFLQIDDVSLHCSMNTFFAENDFIDCKIPLIIYRNLFTLSTIFHSLIEIVQ